MNRNLLLLAAGALALTSCSSDEPAPAVSGADANGESVAAVMFANNTSMTVMSAKAPGARSGEESVVSHGPASQKLENVKEISDIFLSEFPEEERNLNRDHSALDSYSKDFLFLSDGKPYVIYPVYSQTNAKHELGIYYYDAEGTIHQEPIWSMHNNNDWQHLWDGTMGNHYATVIGNGDGIEVSLPEGYYYGYYIRVVEGGEPDTYYSESDLLAINHSEWETTHYYHAVTYTKDDYTFMGFEDWKGQSSPYDMNDLILVSTTKLNVVDNPGEEHHAPETPVDPEEPVQPADPDEPVVVPGSKDIVLNIDPEIRRDIKIDADDFAIRVDGQYQNIMKPVGNVTSFKGITLSEEGMIVKVQNVDNLTAGATDYTYECYMWVREEEWQAMSESEKRPFTEGTDITDRCSIAIPEGYEVRYNVFEGAQSNGSVGYIKVSIHVIRPE